MAKPKSPTFSLPPELRGGVVPTSSPSTKSDDSLGISKGTPMKASPFSLPTKYQRFHALTKAKSPSKRAPRSVARHATKGGHVPIAVSRSIIGGVE